MGAATIALSLRALTETTLTFTSNTMAAIGTILSSLVGLIPPELLTTIEIIAGAIAMALVPAIVSMGASFITAMLPLTPFMAAGAALVALFHAIQNSSGLVQVGLIALASIVGIFTAGLIASTVASHAAAISEAAHSAAIIAKTAVTGVSTVAVNLATAAQWLWNAAMSANPIALVVVAIAGLAAGVTALATHLNSTKRAEEDLQRAQEAQKDATDRLKTSTDRLKDAQDDLAGAELGAEAAALRVERAQKSYNDALRQYGAESLEAREAALNLKQAKHDQEQADNRLKASTAMVTMQTNEQAHAAIEAKAKTDELTKAEEALAQSQRPLSQKISDAWNGIRESIGKHIQLPHIKLPHFSIQPSGWGFGDLFQGVIPRLGIEWKAKGGVMTEPTIFGVNPSSGNLLGGGEAGPEAIAPIDVLQKYIREAVADQDNSGPLLSKIAQLLERYLPVLAALTVRLDSGALVGELAPAMDGALGSMTARRNRGLSE